MYRCYAYATTLRASVKNDLAKGIHNLIGTVFLLVTPRRLKWRSASPSVHAIPLEPSNLVTLSYFFIQLLFLALVSCMRIPRKRQFTKCATRNNVASILKLKWIPWLHFHCHQDTEDSRRSLPHLLLDLFMLKLLEEDVPTNSFSLITRVP